MMEVDALNGRPLSQWEPRFDNPTHEWLQQIKPNLKPLCANRGAQVMADRGRDNRMMLLAWLSMNQRQSLTMIAEALALPRETARHYLKKLKAERLIFFEMDGCTPYWSINQSGEEA